MFMNGYRCVVCDTAFAFEYDGYLCDVCGGNLDITYDYEAAANEIGRGFPEAPGGLFRYAPLLPLNPARPPFPLRVGATPLVRAGRLGMTSGLNNLYLKDDTLNPSASLKDRASAVVVSRARDIDVRVISAASTGNAGSSLACVAAACGMRAVVFVPETAPAAKLAQLLAFGAYVLAVRGSYDDAYELCREASGEFGWFNRSSGINAFTREGKKTCAYEIWEHLGRVPDRVVVPSGDGNILSAAWKGWCDLKTVGLTDRLPKIDCAQSESSAAINNTVNRIRADKHADVDWSKVSIEPVNATTVADSIAVNQPRDGLAAVKAVIESGGEAVSVPDSAILEAIPHMARNSGVFPEPAAAASWAALQQMASDKRVDSGETVVCLVTGSGLKDVTSSREVIGEPRVIEPTLDAVHEALET